MQQRQPNRQGRGIGSVIILLVILCINFPILIAPAVAGLIIFFGIYRARKASQPPQGAPPHSGVPSGRYPQSRAAAPAVRGSAPQLPPRRAHTLPKGNFWRSGKDPWDLPPEPDPWDL